MEPTIYLFFKGNCLEATTHYAETLGGKFWGTLLNGDAPDPESRMLSGHDMVLNMAMSLGNAAVMASDNSDEICEKPQGFCVSMPAGSREEFDRIYDALAKDAEAIEMAPDETFWAKRFAMFDDKYGTPWIFNYEGNTVQVRAK